MADGESGGESARLMVVLDARLDKFEEKMNRASRSAHAAAGKIEGAFNKVNLGKALDTTKIAVLQQLAPGADRFATALGKIGPAGIAAGLGVAAVYAAMLQAKAAMDYADQISDTANRLHVTTDELQEYRYAIRAAGGEEKGADEALEAFSVTLGKAQEGLEKSKKGFRALGFTDAEIASWKTVDQAMTAVIGRIQELKSDPQRDAVIQQLGLDGIKPLVNEGLDGVQRLRAEARSIGVVMDANLIAKAGEAHDKFETLQRVVSIQLMSAFVDLAPVLVGLMQTLAEMATFAGTIADNFRSIEGMRTQGIKDRLSELDAAETKIRNDTRNKDRDQTLVLKPGVGPSPIFDSGIGPNGVVIGGTKVTANDALDIIKDAKKPLKDELAKREAALAASVKPPGGNRTLIDQGANTPDKSAQVAQRSQQVITDALQAQAAAQIQLVLDGQARLEFEKAKIRSEEAEANARLDYEVSQKQITASAASQAKAANAVAAQAKIDLAQREQDWRDRNAIDDALQNQISAESQLSDNVDDRLKAEIDRIKYERDQAATRIDHDASLTKAAADQVKLANERTAQARIELATREALLDKQRQALQDEQQLADWSSSVLRVQADLADTMLERYAIERRILLLAQKRERDELEMQLAAEKASGKYGDGFDAHAAAARAGLAAKQSAEAEGFDAGYVKDLKSGLLDMWDAVRNRGQSTFDYLAERFKQKLLDGAAEQLAQLLLDFAKQASQSGGGGSGGTNYLAMAASAFASLIGGHADGTTSSPGGWKMVGERGPELMNVKPGAAVIANHTLRAMQSMSVPAGAGAPIIYNNYSLRGAVVTEDLLNEMRAIGAGAESRAAQRTGSALMAADRSIPQRLAQLQAHGR